MNMRPQWNDGRLRGQRGLDPILEEMGNSSHFAFGVFQRRVGVRHTGIVLLPDGRPTYNIDFEAELPSCSASLLGDSMATIGRLKVRRFNPATDEVKRIVWRAKTTDVRALLVIERLLLTDPGPYNLLLNNCRDHVQKSLAAAELLLANYGPCNLVWDNCSYHMLQDLAAAELQLAGSRPFNIMWNNCRDYMLRAIDAVKRLLAYPGPCRDQTALWVNAQRFIEGVKASDAWKIFGGVLAFVGTILITVVSVLSFKKYRNRHDPINIHG